MMHRGSLVACLSMCAALSAAQQLSVDYLFGEAQTLSGDRWVPLAVGARVDYTATVRLGPNAVVELVGGSARMTLAAPGAYPIRDLIARRAAADRGLGAFLQSAVRTLLAPPGEKGSPLGARAGEVKGEPSAWVDEDEVALDKAQALLLDGRIAEARELLLKARGETTSTAPFDFLMAYSAALERKAGVALSLLRMADTDRSARYREEALALHAQLALEADAPAEAAGVAGAYLAEYPTGARAQDCALIEGLAQRALGNGAASRAALERAVKMGPDTESGRLAASELR